MMRSINKVIKELKNTELGFAKLDLKQEGKCNYCAEGVLVKGMIDDETLEADTYISLYDLATYKPFVAQSLKDKYGIDFSNEKLSQRIECLECNGEISSLNYLLTHTNDYHSDSHKQTAEILERTVKLYKLRVINRI